MKVKLKNADSATECEFEAFIWDEKRCSFDKFLEKNALMGGKGILIGTPKGLAVDYFWVRDPVTWDCFGINPGGVVIMDCYGGIQVMSQSKFWAKYEKLE